MQLRQDIGKLSLLLTAIGGIVGSGWLLAPYYAAKIAGPAATISWLLGGILMMIIAFTFAELATAFPIAGGIVRFGQFSHGTFTSFTIAWISWLAAVMVAPIETMAALQYAGNYLPQLIYSVNGETLLSHTGVLAAAVLMFIMCFFNQFGIRYFAKSNSMIVIWKLCIPIITILILLNQHFDLHNFSASGGFAPDGFKGILYALPAAGVIFSFIGYSAAIQLAGEAKNPQKAISYAILGAITIAIVLYVLLEVAFVGAVQPDSINHGWKHMTFSHDAGPIAGLLIAFGMSWYVKIIYADALISPIGTAYIYTAATARMNYAMSENGYMPSWMQKLNIHGTPFFSLLFNYAVGMIFFLPFPGWQQMVGFIVSCFVIAYAIGPVACATLRTTMPEINRPFKVPGYQWFCPLAFYICNLILYWTGWSVIWKMMVTLLIGYLIFFMQYFILPEKIKLNINKAMWLFPYLIGTMLISYFGAFGGTNAIKFGIDFFVIALFSLAIYYYAVYCGNKSN